MIAPLIAVAVLARQTLKLPPLFSDNMVLERGEATPFFGEAAPGSDVVVELAGQTASTKAGEDGKWNVRLPPLLAGGPFVGTVHSGSTTVSIQNVLIGEVWLCSGQSNMEFREAGASDYAAAQQTADPSIRTFVVSQTSTEAPASEVRGKWTPAAKTTVGGFSGVALAFGRELHDKLNVPIGLIQATWGGTRAEAWTSREALNANESLKSIVDAYQAEMADYPTKNMIYRSELKDWIASRADSGNEGFMEGWEDLLIDDSSWKSVNLPGTVDSMEPTDNGKPFDGAVWFRRRFDLPPAWSGKALRLELGPIADYDDAYVNGTKIGYTKVATEDASQVARSYRIAPGILVDGSNVIAIRVYAAQGACGLTGFPEQMCVKPWDGDSDDPIPLAGPWREKVERKVDTTKEAPHMPLGPGNPGTPSGLFNGMIQPLIPYRIKGVIWYQGEANVDHPNQYRTLFPTLIKDWRGHWGDAELPFYFVQLPNFGPRQAEPGESSWADLREAQATALKLSNTAMANTIDLGSADTIHPPDKLDVGRRLAWVALSRNYRQHDVWQGPEFHSMAINGSMVRVFFQHVEDGLKTSDSKAPTGFQIAGEDRKFYWATAKIEGEAVVVSSPQVPNPVAVRYGWADNPPCNLYNSAGLPAEVFRTDRWPTATD